MIVSGNKHIHVCLVNNSISTVKFFNRRINSFSMPETEEIIVGKYDTTAKFGPKVL